ncbi:MAG: rhomboid family intramembrane serine protease [Magnetococcales bacterium]|nr:rhomboid family intramembrane serine protease [Magnetococcales bacterium]
METDANAKTRPPTFAIHLARHLIAHKDYKLHFPPEARELAAEGRIVLSYFDGIWFRLCCIIDRDAHPDHSFDLPLERIKEIGSNCLQYTGRMNGQPVPVHIKVIEVGSGRFSTAEAGRLQQYKDGNNFAKTLLLSAWFIDPETGMIWNNASLLDRIAWNRYFKQVLRHPTEGTKKPGRELNMTGTPWLTWLVMTIIAICYGVELAYGIGSHGLLDRPSIATLVALGGVNKSLVLQAGEWQRILIAPWLHASLLHLSFNLLALQVGGSALERLLGSAWMLAIYLLSALGGVGISMYLNSPDVISVGASGAIMGVLAATLVSSSYTPMVIRVRLQSSMLQMLLPALLPIVISKNPGGIDFAGHLGGTLAGGLAGWLLLKFWNHELPRPGLQKLAIVWSLSVALAVAVSVHRVADNYDKNAFMAQLVPSSQLPKSEAEWHEKLADLEKRYPRDPRPHLYRALTLAKQHDETAAIQELRHCLRDQELVKQVFPAKFLANMQGYLALLLANQKQWDEAKILGAQACPRIDNEELRANMNKIGLCK